MDKSTYKKYTNVTKEVLDSIGVGDLIVVNDWDSPMIVKGVSENYFVMVDVAYEAEQQHYSVCEKKLWDGVQYNSMAGGMFHVGPDSWLFGAPIERDNLYQFDDEDATTEYLGLFESGEGELSQRNAIPIRLLYVHKKSKFHRREGY